VSADDLVAVDLEVGDVVALDVPAELAEAGEQLAGRVDLLRRGTHAAAPATGAAGIATRLADLM
jgi:hypothetical protein